MQQRSSRAETPVTAAGERAHGGAVPGRPEGGYRPDPRRWRALTVCLVAVFMTLIDDSIVNVAVPSIRTDLDASASTMSWVLSGYPLAFGLALVPAGRLGDARGRRRVFRPGGRRRRPAGVAAAVTPRIRRLRTSAGRAYARTAVTSRYSHSIAPSASAESASATRSRSRAAVRPGSADTFL